MRIAYLGDFSTDWATEAYVAAALSSLHDVAVSRVSQYHHTSPASLIDQLKRREIDVLILSKPKLLGREPVWSWLAEVRRHLPKVKIVCWYFDLFRREYDLIRHQQVYRVAKECDLFFSTDAGGQAELGLPNVRLLRQGYGGPLESKGSRNTRSDWQCDLAHLGSVYGERKAWYAQMQEAFPDFRVFSKVRGNDLFDLMKSAKIVVGPSWPEAKGYYSNRAYVVAGYGGCLATPEVEGMAEEGWVPGEHYINLSRGQDGIDELRYVWLRDRSDPEHIQSALEEIRQAAQKLVFERHTYKHRAAELVKQIKEIL